MNTWGHSLKILVLGTVLVGWKIRRGWKGEISVNRSELSVSASQKYETFFSETKRFLWNFKPWARYTSTPYSLHGRHTHLTMIISTNNERKGMYLLLNCVRCFVWSRTNFYYGRIYCCMLHNLKASPHFDNFCFEAFLYTCMDHNFVSLFTHLRHRNLTHEAVSN